MEGFEEIKKNDYQFKALDGQYYPTIDDVERANNTYWEYKNPFIIDKDDDLFDAPLSKEVFDRIISSPTYRSLIDELEKILAQRLSTEDTNTKKR